MNTSANDEKKKIIMKMLAWALRNKHNELKAGCDRWFPRDGRLETSSRGFQSIHKA